MLFEFIDDVITLRHHRIFTSINWPAEIASPTLATLSRPLSLKALTRQGSILNSPRARPSQMYLSV